MTYKDALCQAMKDLAKDPLVCFVGYGIKYGAQGAGTFKGINPEQLIETPTAENLMAGVAIGLSLKGRRPLLYIERADFLLHCLDAIVNHLDKMSRISDGAFNPAMIIRVVVGNTKKPLFTGPTHTQNFLKAMRHMVDFTVDDLPNVDRIVPAYGWAYDSMSLKGVMARSTMLFEYKDQI